MSEVSFARAGETHVAFRLWSASGSVDLVMVAGAFFPMSSLASDRVARRFMDGLGSLGRLVVFDKRGVGLSDPIIDWGRSVQEQWADDLIAVIIAAGLEDSVVVSWDTQGVGRVAASRRSDLFGGLVLINPSVSPAFLSQQFAGTEVLDQPRVPIERLALPSRIDEPGFREWLSEAGYTGASPSSSSRLWSHLLSYEGDYTPHGIDVPTIVIHVRDSVVPRDAAERVAEAIPNATLVSTPGVDAYPISGDVDPILAEIARFVTGTDMALPPERMVAAVLFTDLVGSTDRATDEGDDRWRDLLDRHDRISRRCITHRGGEVIKYTGDGLLAILPSTTAAVAAAHAIRDELVELGLSIRAGVHVGDIDRRGDDVSGLAVNTAARIMSHAPTDHVTVSESARRATAGSGLVFTNPRTVHLKGIPDTWLIHDCLDPQGSP